MVADVVGRRSGDQGRDGHAGPPRLAGRDAQDDGRRGDAPAARPLGHHHRQCMGHDRRAQIHGSLSRRGDCGGNDRQSRQRERQPVLAAARAAAQLQPAAAGGDHALGDASGRRRRAVGVRPGQGGCAAHPAADGGVQDDQAGQRSAGAGARAVYAGRRDQGDDQRRSLGRAQLGGDQRSGPDRRDGDRQPRRPVRNAQCAGRDGGGRIAQLDRARSGIVAGLLWLGAARQLHHLVRDAAQCLGPVQPAGDASRGDVLARDPRAIAQCRDDGV